MERNYLKKQLTLRLIIYSAFAILLYGAAATYHSAAAGLIKRTEGNINVLVLTRPPMFIAYNPKFKKAVVNNLPYSKKQLSQEEILKKANIKDDNVISVNLDSLDRTEFWDGFKKNLKEWRQKPFLIFSYFYSYFKLKFKGKTELSFGDFLLISTELSTLKTSDFAVQNPPLPKAVKGKKKKEAPPVTITTDIKPNKKAKGPLVIEVLNASGKNGLAGEVTKFLRELNNGGVISVDVINYASYPELLETTKILDNTSRLLEIQQTAYQLGLEGREIFSQQDKNSISDVKIILGKDFVLPKRSK